MTTESVPAEHLSRHTADDASVTGSMARFRVFMPFVRALILAGVVILLIMFGLPRVLAIAAAASF